MYEDFHLLNTGPTITCIRVHEMVWPLPSPDSWASVDMQIRMKWSWPFPWTLTRLCDQLGECRGVHGNGHDHFHELLNTRTTDQLGECWGDGNGHDHLHEPNIRPTWSVGRVLRSSWKWSWPFPWTPRHSHNWSVGRVLGRWKWYDHFHLINTRLTMHVQ